MERLSYRRILTFPTIQPCSGVCPTALLDAIIVLANEIVALRLKAFPIHRHSVREMIREVGAILLFLEDVRRRRSGFLLVPRSSSAVVGFSELYVTLQKAHLLLRDCARPDARIWILARSEQVSCEFRILIRSIATALDVLPLDSIDASSEVKEMVRLVRAQAWKVPIETDLADNQALWSTFAVLEQLKHGVAPTKTDLWYILDHLLIKNWSDCNQEIAFLEELLFASLEGDLYDDEIAIVSSLIGFMVYCRVVLFDIVEEKTIKRKECRNLVEAIGGLNSDDLRCPISLELMTDPVTVSTGQTYDRASIARWLKDGDLTCPVTGEKLARAELVPNSAIRNLVEQFCHSKKLPFPEPNINQKRDLSKTASSFSSAGAGAIRMAATFLVDQLACGTTQEKMKATYEIRKLSKSNIFNRACLVKAGIVPWLLHLFSCDGLVQENAVAALLNLSKHPKGRTAIVEAGGLSLTVDVMKLGFKVEAQQNAAAILFYLSSVDEYRKLIGETPEAIRALMELIREGTYRGKKNAIVTLFGLLFHPENLPKVLAAGATPTLSNLLLSERKDIVNDSVAVLAKLAERPEGTKAILKSSAVCRLVEVLRSSTSRSGREHCVSILLSLCNNGGVKVVSSLEQMPVLMPSLYTLITDGSPQASKKARLLLNQIHRLHDLEHAAILTPTLQDRVVRAQ